MQFSMSRSKAPVLIKQDMRKSRGRSKTFLRMGLSGQREAAQWVSHTCANTDGLWGVSAWILQDVPQMQAGDRTGGQGKWSVLQEERRDWPDQSPGTTDEGQRHTAQGRKGGKDWPCPSLPRCAVGWTPVEVSRHAWAQPQGQSRGPRGSGRDRGRSVGHPQGPGTRQQMGKWEAWCLGFCPCVSLQTTPRTQAVGWPGL